MRQIEEPKQDLTGFNPETSGLSGLKKRILWES